MCFSFIASFSSAGVLWLIGLGGLWINYYCDYYFSLWNYNYSQIKRNNENNENNHESSRNYEIINEILIKQMKYESKYWWFLLFTPIFFGIQQFCEGFVWIYLKQNMNAQIPGFCFSFFA